ncbi:hypothetical protein [Hwanghaeella sp.]|uniref:hypothetical protein n=1 Tax=Hwanghaeella sp. TaxID=2605943 RepID=UPI003CCB9127
MFDVDRFIEECRAAVAEDDSHKAVREVTARAMADPAALLKALGEPTEGSLQKLYHGDELTILNVIWPAEIVLRPHNHNNIWAVIGVYGGREDNIFWRRKGDRIEAAGAASLMTGDAAPLGKDIIHSVINPTGKLTAALHIYGGDFFNDGRSEWNPEDLTERPFDFQESQRQFEEANARFRSKAA